MSETSSPSQYNNDRVKFVSNLRIKQDQFMNSSYDDESSSDAHIPASKSQIFGDESNVYRKYTPTFKYKKPLRFSMKKKAVTGS
jgi:hypothetical protein